MPAALARTPDNPADRGRPAARSGGTLPSDRLSLALEAAELVSCDPETSPILCDTYLYEAERGEESLGSLALVAETIQLPSRPLTEENADVPDLPESARDMLDAVASALRDAYYADPSRDMLESFEAALAAANATLAKLVDLGAADWLLNLHAAVAVFRGSTLHVSRTGSASLLLARHGLLTDIGEGLADQELRNTKMTFSNIASGSVSDEDTLVLASPQLLRIVPRDRLPSFLLGKHPREAVAYIRDLLAETADAAPFALLLLRFVRAPFPSRAPHPVPRIQPLRAEAGGPPSTGWLTSLPGRVGGDGSARSLGSRTAALERPRIAPRPPLRLLRQTPLQRALAIARRSAVVTWVLIRTRGVPALARAARASSRAARTVVQKTSPLARDQATRVRKRLPTTAPTEPPWGPAARAAAPRRTGPALLAGVRALPDVTRGVPRDLRRAFESWPRSTRTFFILTVLFALLFVGSVLLLQRKRTEDAAIRAASEQLQEARVKADSAAAALIYDNIEEARRLLRGAEESATAVQGTPYYGEEVSALLATIQAVKDKTERIVRVAEPERVGDFSTVAPDGRVSGLAAIGKDLFAFHAETNSIFRLAEGSGEATTVSQTSQGIGYFRGALALPTDHMLLLSTDAPGLALFDASRGDLIRQDIEPLPEGTREIRGVATFGSRLYLLLPEHKQILGYSKTLAGYRGGSPWLQDPSVSVDRAVDIGVDGYIYLLLDDGRIVKLLKGSPVDFSQSELTTPLERPTRLVINDTLSHLYVLDPPQKRVVVYDTTGVLTRQFVFPNASDLRDLAIGGKEEVLYALDGTAVYKVTLK